MTLQKDVEEIIVFKSIWIQETSLSVIWPLKVLFCFYRLIMISCLKRWKLVNFRHLIRHMRYFLFNERRCWSKTCLCEPIFIILAILFDINMNSIWINKDFCIFSSNSLLIEKFDQIWNFLWFLGWIGFDRKIVTVRSQLLKLLLNSLKHIVITCNFFEIVLKTFNNCVAFS